jgi:hypothetical protein
MYTSAVIVLVSSLDNVAAYSGRLTSSLFGALTIDEQAEFREVTWTGQDAMIEQKLSRDGAPQWGAGDAREYVAGYGWTDHHLKVYACGNLHEFMPSLRVLFWRRL